jgi:hypothetical protein
MLTDGTCKSSPFEWGTVLLITGFIKSNADTQSAANQSTETGSPRFSGGVRPFIEPAC